MDRSSDRSVGRRAIAKRSGEDCVESVGLGFACGEACLIGYTGAQSKSTGKLMLASHWSVSIKYDVSAITLCITKSFVKGSAIVCLVRWAMNE
jgi:hypothetical protein